MNILRQSLNCHPMTCVRTCTLIVSLSTFTIHQKADNLSSIGNFCFFFINHHVCDSETHYVLRKLTVTVLVFIIIHIISRTVSSDFLIYIYHFALLFFIFSFFSCCSSDFQCALNVVIRYARTSGFVDDVIFPHSGLYSASSALLSGVSLTRLYSTINISKCTSRGLCSGGEVCYLRLRVVIKLYISSVVTGL